MTAFGASRYRASHRRLRLFQVFATAVFVGLLGSFWQIQVVDHERYREQARQNRIKTLPTAAARGNILDRHGRSIADSEIALTAMIDAANTSAANLGRIASGLDLDIDRVWQTLQDASDYGRFEHIVLKEDLSQRDLAFLQARRHTFREVDLVEGMRRRYPAQQVAVHATGYIGKASRRELALREFLLLDFGSEVGKSGIERQYNSWLTGTDGSLQFIVDSVGRSVDAVGEVGSVPGQNLRLTIDLDLQSVSELGLVGRKGAVVALDPRNGEILAMASAPSFDPNQFVAGFQDAEWRVLNSDPATPLLNRAIQGTWAIGSVIKPIIGLAGLQTGVAGPDFTAHCAGGLNYGGHYFRCHKRDGHGTVALVEAIAQSCDVYFYQLGVTLGIDVLERYARLAGFGERTNVDLPDEVPGLVPSVRCKVRRSLQPWHPGETVVVSIGQGAMSVTPIQAAHAIGGLAVGGVWHQPRIVPDDQMRLIDPDYEPPEPRVAAIDREHLTTLREAMWQVVNGYGTGRQARLSGVEVCGKTGTAQRVSNELRLRSGRADFEDDAWFVGFAPCASPEIVVAALLENGAHSYYAAAVVRDLLQVWLLNRPDAPFTDSGKALAQSSAGLP